MLPGINPISAALTSLPGLPVSSPSVSIAPVSSPSGSGLSFTGLSGTAPAPFSDLLTDAVGQVNHLETRAHNAVTGLMAGSGVDVHQAMIATQKASMAFELALAVRNKAVQAYQSVIGMQF